MMGTSTCVIQNIALFCGTGTGTGTVKLFCYFVVRRYEWSVGTIP